MKQIGLASLMYAQDNHGWFPCLLNLVTVNGKTFLGSSSSYGPFVGKVYDSTGTEIAPTAAAPNPTIDPNAYYCSGLRQLLRKPYGLSGTSYLRTTDCFFCPSDNSRRPYVDPNSGWGPQTLVSGSGLAGPGQSMSYFEWYRPMLDYATSPAGVHPTDNLKAPTWLLNCKLRVPSPAKKVLVADQGLVPNIPAGDTLANAQDFPFFHKKGWNVLYVDGHAQWVDQSYITPYETGTWSTLNFQHAAPMAYWAAGG
jgi:prepilin-type processing-associated H-X9-DG protein